MARRARLSRSVGKPVTPSRLLAWKASLKAVGDNPDYIEEKISAIQKALNKNDPDTGYIREKVDSIRKWLYEIDQFHQRSGLDKEYSKIVQVYPKLKRKC